MGRRTKQEITEKRQQAIAVFEATSSVPWNRAFRTFTGIPSRLVFDPQVSSFTVTDQSLTVNVIPQKIQKAYDNRVKSLYQ